MNLREAAALMNAGEPPASPEPGREIGGYSIDSRSVKSGDLFFALSPPDYRRHSFTATEFGDAHDFIGQALAAGALCVVARAASVAERAELRDDPSIKNRLLLVDDVIDALQSLTRGVIDRWAGTVVAISGSAGKTTTKDLTRSVLDHAGRRLVASMKNFNNELGVPLSVLQMESAGKRATDFDVAVIEMGMSMPGEMAKLAQIAPPRIAVELLVSRVHMQYFGSIERIAEGKRALVEALTPDGVAILNADDERVLAMRDSHPGRNVLFGIDYGSADVSARDLRTTETGGTEFTLRTPRGEARVVLPLPGRHNVSNALAAASVATVLEIAPDVIAGALSAAGASEMRGRLVRFKEGVTLIDDSYNSNPRSLTAMTSSLVEASRAARDAKRRIVVAGEMLELGDEAAQMHREVGGRIAGIGVDRLIGVRGMAAELVAGAREAGLATAEFCETTDAAADLLLDDLRAGDWVLVKGSRGVHTETIVARLRERFAADEGG